MSEFDPLTVRDMPTPFQAQMAHHDSQHQQQTEQQDRRPIELFQYTAHQDQTTLVLGVIEYLRRLEVEIAEMREFVNLGFRRIEAIGHEDGGISATVEE